MVAEPGKEDGLIASQWWGPLSILLLVLSRGEVLQFEQFHVACVQVIGVSFAPVSQVLVLFLRKLKEQSIIKSSITLLLEE